MFCVALRFHKSRLPMSAAMSSAAAVESATTAVESTTTVKASYARKTTSGVASDGATVIKAAKRTCM